MKRKQTFGEMFDNAIISKVLMDCHEDEDQMKSIDRIKKLLSEVREITSREKDEEWVECSSSLNDAYQTAIKDLCGMEKLTAVMLRVNESLKPTQGGK